MMREYVNLANLLTSGSLVAGFLALFLIFQTNNHLIAAAGLVAVAGVEHDEVELLLETL